MTCPVVTTAEIWRLPCSCPPRAKASERCTRNGWIRCVARHRAYLKLRREREAS